MITFENVKKAYKNYNFDIPFMNIPQGVITGLVGKNGAGKSTAIGLITELIKPDSGTVKTFGIPAEKLTPSDKLNLGVFLDNSGFSTQLNVSDIEHILKHMYPEFEREYFNKKCIELNIPKNKKIAEFSSGMKVKLKILVAITHKARLLILDEPTTGLDVEARNEVLDMLRQYVSFDDTRSILITSHISSDLENLCDDIYLIHNGRIILHEDTDAIVEQYGVLKVNEEQFKELDKSYILNSLKENYGYACFVKSKAFYKENYPGIVVENGGIDELILMMTGGYK